MALTLRRFALPPVSSHMAVRGMFSCTAMRLQTPGKIRVTFVNKSGDRKEFLATPGMTLMEVARSNKIDMEAACDGTCACSTCHVYVDEEALAKLPKPSEDELDMLDLAPDVRKTSRLACQIELKPEHDGIVAELPEHIESQF